MHAKRIVIVDIPYREQIYTSDLAVIGNAERVEAQPTRHIRKEN